MNHASSNLLTTVTWAYAAVLLFVVALGFVPGVEDDQGRMFGLFTIDPIDDVIHLASAAWAALAAWKGARWSTFFLKWFGAIYLLDGLLGATVGEGFLDGALFLEGPGIEGVGRRIAANVPHVAIGGLAAYLGFVHARKLRDPATEG